MVPVQTKPQPPIRKLPEIAAPQVFVELSVTFRVLPDACNHFVNPLVKLDAEAFLAAFVECCRQIDRAEGSLGKFDLFHFGTREFSCRMR